MVAALPPPVQPLRPPRRRRAAAAAAAALGAAAFASSRHRAAQPAMHVPQPQPTPQQQQEQPHQPAAAAQAAVQACCGAVAGGLARVAVAPLDVVKIRLQVQLEPCSGAAAGKYRGALQAGRTILAEEGLRGLWRGTAPALLLWAPYTAVQFAALEALNRAARRAGRDPSQPPHSFLHGAAAAAAATVASYPLDVLRTVMAAQGSPPAYATMGAALAGLLRSPGGGPRALWAGLGVTLTEIIPYAGLQFGSYAALKAALVARRAERSASAAAAACGDDAAASAAAAAAAAAAAPLPGWQRFCCGLAAGSLAKLALHPLDVVKKRMQVAGMARPPGYGAPVGRAAARAGPAALLRGVVAREGVRGLYKGLAPNLLKAAPASAITFVCYEYLLAMAERGLAARAAGVAAHTG